MFDDELPHDDEATGPGFIFALLLAIPIGSAMWYGAYRFARWVL